MPIFILLSMNNFMLISVRHNRKSKHRYLKALSAGSHKRCGQDFISFSLEYSVKQKFYTIKANFLEETPILE